MIKKAAKEKTALTFYARGDAAKGKKGNLRLRDTDEQPTVELVFDADTLPYDASRRRAMPKENQTVLVDGVERYYWVELAGQLRKRKDLRDVKGHDLCETEVRVITTDDTRRFVFIAEPDLPRDVVDAIPAGPRRAIV